MATVCLRVVCTACSLKPPPLPPRNRNTTQAEYTTTEFLQLSLEIQLALYNGVLLTWKEKVGRTLLKHGPNCHLVLVIDTPVFETAGCSYIHTSGIIK